MGNKNTCLFYKSANKPSDIPDVNSDIAEALVTNA
jgi:hypothetical protein